MSQVPEPVVFVSTQSGRLEDANPAAAELFGMKVESLVGCQFHTLANRTLGRGVVGNTGQRHIERRWRARDDAHQTQRRRVASEPDCVPRPWTAHFECAVCWARPKATLAPMRPRFRRPPCSATAATRFVFTDPKGVIASVNDGFMDLVGAGHLGDLVGKSLGDFLARGQIDLGVLTDNAERGSQMRMYGTKVVNRLGFCGSC